MTEEIVVDGKLVKAGESDKKETNKYIWILLLGIFCWIVLLLNLGYKWFLKKEDVTDELIVGVIVLTAWIILNVGIIHIKEKYQLK